MDTATSRSMSAENQDIAALMRDGVKALTLVGGLPEALARLSAHSARDLGTRAGIAEVLAEVRLRFPVPDDTRLRLRITTATPPEAVKVFDQIRAVLKRDPTVGLLRERWPVRGSMPFSGPQYEVSGAESVSEDAREAWDVLTSIAVACRIRPRAIESARALAVAGARALRCLEGRQKTAVSAVAAIPRPYALDPDAAAIAYAHAPRERGAVAVLVVNATVSAVWRTSGKSGIRPVEPRPWHRDPTIAAALAAVAKASIARCAPCQVTAPEGETWTQVLIAQREDRFEGFVQRLGGRVDHVEIVGQDTWASLGVEGAAQLAATSGLPVGVDSRGWTRLGLTNDFLHDTSLASLLEASPLSQPDIARFKFRLEGAVRRTTDAAILAFLAGLPKATAQLARLIRPIQSWDPKSNRRFTLGRRELDAAVSAATHSDPSAMVHAVENPSTRALVLAAGLQGPWRVAAEAIVSGAPPRKALLLYGSAAIDRPLSRAAVKCLAGWPVSSGIGSVGVDTSFSGFTDLTRLAAVLWAETPSRPPMTTSQLVTLMHGLKQFGFVPPSAAGPDDRTWDDPTTTTAYAAALRRERDDVVGSAPLGHGIADVIHFLDGKLVALGLARDAREAVRCISLVPPGRLAPGLERLSDEWHRSILRMTRERNVLVEELISDEIRSWDETVLGELPEDYPNPLSGEIVYGEVVIRPLRTPREIDREGEEMANCVSTYRDEARIGDLLLYRLESPFGRSTLGLKVTDSARACEIEIYQHHGPQHSSVDAPPPLEHADTASWLMSSLTRRDGGSGGPRWRAQLLASRRAHARSASSRPSEQNLSPARRRRLAELDLVHLGGLLGKNERRFDLDQFHRWAERLAVAFISRTESSTPYGNGAQPRQLT